MTLLRIIYKANYRPSTFDIYIYIYIYIQNYYPVKGMRKFSGIACSYQWTSDVK